MTSVTPYQALPPSPLGGARDRAQREASDGPDFASILGNAEADRSPDLLLPGSTALESAGLSNAIATQFNASGFFEAPVSLDPKSAQAASPQTNPDQQAQFGEITHPEAAPERSAPPAEIEASAGSVPGDHVPGDQSMMPASAGPPPPHQLSPALPRTPEPIHGAREGSALATVSELPDGQAKTVGEGAEDPQRSQPASVQAQSPDRFTFRIGERLVELTARLPHLSADEEEQLMRELGSLLEGYGLRLGSATINGTPAAARVFKGRS